MGPLKDSEELKLLKAKLKAFEENLQDLLEATKEDLTIAEQLQKVLMPNRIPEIPGLKCYARYISAHQVSSEGFDIIPTKDGRELWLVTSWTESFGLSSVLLQALVHLQSKATLESRPKVKPQELFNDLATSLSLAKKAAGYRLMVAQVDIASLNISGVSIGMAPPLRRIRDRNQHGAFDFVQAEAFAQQPDLLKPGHSAAPTLAEKAYQFSFTLAPGARLFLLSSEWNRDAENLSAFSRPLALEKQAAVADSELLDDLNYLLIRAEDHKRRKGAEVDVSALAIEVDAKKLHLA